MLQRPLFAAQTYTSPFDLVPDLARVRASEYVVFDLETTALTAFDKPTAVGKSAPIGPELTWNQYRGRYGGGIDCRPRARIVSVGLSDGGKLAFDLDTLSREGTIALLKACINDKLVVGWNLGFDFAWAAVAMDEDLRPAMVLDGMLIVRALRPALPFKLHELAAAGASELEAISLKTYGSVSLASISAAMGFPQPDKSWQHARNWCVEHLCRGHYDYCLSGVTLPLELLYRIFRCGDIKALCDAIAREDAQRGVTYTQIYSRAPAELAAIHRRGVPISATTSDAIEAHRAGRIAGAVTALLKKAEGLVPFEAKLRSMAPGLPAALKMALGEHAKAHGCTLTVGDDGAPIVAKNRSKLVGVDKVPGWSDFSRVQHDKQHMASIAEWRAASAVDGRAHAWLSVNAITLRLTAKSPNAQNMSRAERGLAPELQIRSIVEAPEGYSILSVDLSQADLRTAAALGERAIAQARRALAGELEVPGWVMECLERGASDAVLEVDRADFDGYRARFANAWRLVVQNGNAMADAFRAGVDVHLLTAVGLQARLGTLDLGGCTPLAYIQRRGQAELLVELADARQAAKAPNFGLLYGMGAPGLWASGIVQFSLTWSLADATAARTAWLDDYAAVAFWQFWAAAIGVETKAQARRHRRSNPYTRKDEIVPVRLRVGTTLSGRPVVGAEARDMLNYCDQGSVADMVMDAIGRLPEEAHQCLINMVHDELVFCVPDRLLDIVRGQAVAAMVACADKILGPWGVPMLAEASHGKCWS